MNSPINTTEKSQRCLFLALWALFWLSIPATGATAPDAPRYAVTDLGTCAPYADLGYNGWKINNTGQVVGQTGGYACLWSNGRWSDLGALAHTNSAAFGINDRGQVIGHMTVSGGVYHAFLWQNGRLTDLGSPKAWSDANGINAQGRIVGTADIVGIYHHAVLWENGHLRDLGTLGGHYGVGTGINNHDQVVGFSSYADEQSQRGFLWSGGKMRDLGTMPGFSDYAPNAINDRGQITGWAFSWDMRTHTSTSPNHAFLWENCKMTDLGTLGGHDSHAYGLNNAGQVIGWANTADGRTSAFLFQNGKMVDLNIYIAVPQNASSLDAQSHHLSLAAGINDKGQIVAFGDTINNVAHIYLLSPVTAGKGTPHE
jgi:probable HAF family extracellular repeat protein